MPDTSDGPLYISNTRGVVITAGTGGSGEGPIIGAGWNEIDVIDSGLLIFGANALAGTNQVRLRRARLESNEAMIAMTAQGTLAIYGAGSPENSASLTLFPDGSFETMGENGVIKLNTGTGPSAATFSGKGSWTNDSESDFIIDNIYDDGTSLNMSGVITANNSAPAVLLAKGSPVFSIKNCTAIDEGSGEGGIVLKNVIINLTQGGQISGDYDDSGDKGATIILAYSDDPSPTDGDKSLGIIQILRGIEDGPNPEKVAMPDGEAWTTGSDIMYDNATGQIYSIYPDSPPDIGANSIKASRPLGGDASHFILARDGFTKKSD
jgi:hypothetical protein